MDAKNVRVNVMLPKALHETMKKESKKLGLSVSALICVSVNEYLKQASVIDMVHIMQQIKDEPEKMGKEFAGMINTILLSGSPDGIPAIFEPGAPSAKRIQKGIKKADNV
jgi:hypothetical protein